MDRTVVLRLPQVIQRVQLSKPGIYALMAEGQFPKPIKLGKRATGWIEAEIDIWLAERIAVRDAAEGARNVAA